VRERGVVGGSESGVLSSFGMLSCETAVSDLGALLCFGLVLLWSVEWVHGFGLLTTHLCSKI